MKLLNLLILLTVGTAYQVSSQSRRTPFLRYRSKDVDPAINEKMVSANKIPIQNARQLRSAVLDQGHCLKDVKNQADLAVTATDVLTHDVIKLMAERFASKSTPLNRTDSSKLALAIEGGGMRGAVAAGMAAAIDSLGLLDTIDVVYGSSAGSVVGANLISRQMATDIYTDLLPNAKHAFVCKKRLIASCFSKYVNQAWGLPNVYKKPGMNLSYVLDTVLEPADGLRPLDMKAFQHYDAHHQPLRVVTSCVNDAGELITKCFGTTDFTNATTSDAGRSGLFACLEASMTVPGATGAPVQITLNDNTTVKAFDAFCFEPLPYRSAVKEGATHVMVLRSRPQDYVPKTQPGLYEKHVAPNYFSLHGEPTVGDFFAQGGQQYLYYEDLMTLEEGRQSVSDPICIPPSQLVYGVADKGRENSDRSTWQRAHVLPVTVPTGTAELSTLEQDPQLVLEAVRGGFETAYNLLAPAIGIVDRDGEQVAHLLFPDNNDDINSKSLQEPSSLPVIYNLDLSRL